MNIRMTTKGKRPLRSLTPSDKIHAIQRIHDGESKASVARDIGVPESTLRGWCKNEDKLRFMSRQSASDKMAADSLTDKLVDGAAAAAAALLGGPPEKRPKMESSMPLNFSNKIKYEDLGGYKRSPLNGLDFSTNKALSDLSFNGLGPDYNAFKNAEMVAMNGVKNKGYGADLSRQNDPSLTAISPLSSLSHLSGLTGLGHSPLAISFNELTSNLNLIAQLNPSLAATMSSLNGINPNSLRNVKPKPQPMHSPRSNDGDRMGQGLSVKNWAKQKNSGTDNNYGLNLCANDKNKMKCPSPSLAPSLGAGMPAMDDPLLYWLKSQQAMLGLNSLYPPNPPSSSSPPMRSSTPQQHGHASTPPISSTPQTPNLTPSGSLDEKNSVWFNWCKAFGASLNSLAPHSALQPSSTTLDIKPQFENILYSHLTKESSSPHSSDALNNNNNNNEVTSNSKPEDLSAKSSSIKSPSPAHSPVIKSEADTVSSHQTKDALDSLLYKINHTNNNNGPTSIKHEPSTENATIDQDDHDRELENNSSGSSSSHNMQVGNGSESDASYNSDSLNNNDNHDPDNISHNNNNNSNKTDEEERGKYASSDCEDVEAIEHGEKFLKWLENCSNPRVTSVQLMQLRFLISAIKSGSEKQHAKDSDEENKVAKIRRRK